MRWYVNYRGQPEGPFEEAAVIEWISTGALVSASVCPEGGNQWMGLGQHPAFAHALMPPLSDEPRESFGSTVTLGTFEGSKKPSEIPPPPEADIVELAAPVGSRTPRRPIDGIDFEGQLPDNAPAWMHHAQRMIAGLRQALAQGNVPPATEAGIERAWAGWELDGSTERQIGRLALLLEQAHTAVRDSTPETFTQVVQASAQLVYRGMPKHARAHVNSDDVEEVVRQFRDEHDAWAAVVHATARLLGWARAGAGHSAHIVRLAIENYRQGQPPSGPGSG